MEQLYLDIFCSRFLFVKVPRKHAICEYKSYFCFISCLQAFIDNAYQRIRLEADRYRDQQEAIVQDAQRQIADARKKQTDAENQSGQLQMRVLELENEARALNLQQEELQTALLVATRSSSQTSQDQELISSLREAVTCYFVSSFWGG